MDVSSRMDMIKQEHHGQDSTSQPRKSKKRLSKKSNLLGNWLANAQSEQSGDHGSSMEYSQVLWQPGIQQPLLNHNGQRLFTAMSDPSVCGYSPIPMTYTMEPVSLPTMYRLYQPVPLPGIGTIRGRQKQNFPQSHLDNPQANSHVVGNGYTSLQEHMLQSTMPVSYHNGDYASLPSTANKSNGINGDELNSEHRRYSDPGLGPADLPIHTQNDDSDSADSGSSITTIGRSNKLVLSLIEQMTELKRSNSQLFKELNQTKSELEIMKVKLIQYKHNLSSDYQPGMLSDLISEIREANKVCEEGLVAKVQSMVEERHNQRLTELDLLKNQLLKVVQEKEDSERRVANLEREVATLKLNANNEGREIAAFEEETLALRRELQEALASRTLAENHAAKCVNAVARSVTPVTFEMPCITSTPVRTTGLSGACNLVSAISSSIPCTFESNIPRSRSAEVFSLVQDKTNHRHRHRHHDHHRDTLEPDAKKPTSNSPTWNTADARMENGSTSTELEDSSSAVGDADSIDECPTLMERGSPNLEEPSPIVPIGPRPAINSEAMSSLVPPTDEDSDKNCSAGASNDHGKEELNEGSREGKATNSTTSNNYELFERFVLMSSRDDHASKFAVVSKDARFDQRKEGAREEKTDDRPIRERSKETSCQRGEGKGSGSSFKRARRKRSGTSIKRSSNEADKPVVTTKDDVFVTNSTNDDNSLTSIRRAMSAEEEGHRHRHHRHRGDDDSASRAITEIPEVAVVGGGSLVPKDLCSTRILTSRVLTTPSRATYTTAYI